MRESKQRQDAKLDGRPGCQCPHRPGPNRRQFLQRAAIARRTARRPSAAFLDACSKAGPVVVGPEPDDRVARTARSSGTSRRTTSRSPTGSAPEKGATLQLYSYADYLSPDAVKSFEDKYGAKVQISTFNDTDEAITKIRGGNVDYDIFFPSYDQISRLVTGGLVRPLNHSYIPNIKNVWPIFTNPWYDQDWRYTVPYTVYTTGIGWRTDQVPADIGALKNPYESLWDPAYKNKTAVIDDWHTAMAMVLLKHGITDVNTSSADDLKMVGEQLTRDGGGHLAEGHHHDVQRPARRPDRPVADVVRRHHQRAELSARGRRRRHPALLVPRGRQGPGGQRPDGDAARWQEPGAGPPVPQPHARPRGRQAELLRDRLPAAADSINPDSLVADGFIPENLKTRDRASPEYFDTGYRLLELDPANDAAWHNVWRAFKAGGS